MRVIVWASSAAAIAVAQGQPVATCPQQQQQQPAYQQSCGQTCTGSAGGWQLQETRSECASGAPPRRRVATPKHKPCNSYTDCSGHGSTSDNDKTNGCECQCFDGYTGRDCHKPPPCTDMDDCSGHGSTIDRDRTDGCQCKCKTGFSGDDCSVDVKCNALTDCNGHGTTCDPDNTDGCNCKCQGGYTGDACEVPPPCDAAAADGCSGHGSTDDLNKTNGCDCDCYAGWGEENCAQPKCHELHVPSGCQGLDGKTFQMFVKGFDTGHSEEHVLDKWLSFDGAAGHRVLAAYDHKEDAMPLLFHKAGKCNTYKLQNKATDKWLGEADGRWIQANSNKDTAATFELVVAECDETLSGPNHADYRGCQSQTRSGRICQKWTAQKPFTHHNTPENRPDSGLGDHNHCRNPDGDSTIWCYTTDCRKRWDFCDPKPQSLYKMHVKGRYLNYAVRDHSEDHINGSIEADFTAKDAMTFHLHRECNAKLPDERPGWPWWWLLLLIPLVLALACCVCRSRGKGQKPVQPKPSPPKPIHNPTPPNPKPVQPKPSPPKPIHNPQPKPSPPKPTQPGPKPPRRPCRFRWITLRVPLPFCGRVDEGSKTAH